MNIDYADRINQSVTMRDVCSMYGLQVNRGGFCRSPFAASDSTPSMKVYNGNCGWYDFSTNQGGSVIDFVKKFFGLPFLDAVRKLNTDFKLGLPIDTEPDAKAKQEARLAAQKRRAEQEKRRRTLSALRTAYDNALTRYVRLDRLVDQAHTAAKSGGLAAITDEMAYALGNIDGAWYELCEAQTRLCQFERRT